MSRVPESTESCYNQLVKNYQYYSKKGSFPETYPVNGRMAIVGNCATEALSQVIKGYFADNKIGLEVLDLGYDTASLSILDDSSPLYGKPVTFLLLYFSPLKLRDKFYATSEKEKFAEDFGHELEGLIGKLKTKNITTLITSLPTALDRCLGNASATNSSTLIFQLQKINTIIKETVSANSHCQLLDIEYIANRIGLDRFHSDKLWILGKYPAHTNYFPDIASAVYGIDSALRGRLKKVVVIDLDNTVWGGMVGEDGVNGIALGSSIEGEAFRAFQNYLRNLKEKGFLLCVCSKNDFANAVSPFRDHPEMILKEEDITLFVANWEAKSANLKAMADTLNLGLDSFVFVDDSPFERNEVRAAYPEVLVPELSDDPSEYSTLLDKTGLTEKVNFTDTDRSRSEMYRNESKRQMVKNVSSNIDDYLKSLEMNCLVEGLNARNIERASQLILRSNQFNLRTQRLTKPQLESISLDPRYLNLCFTLTDKFGDYGLISVLVGEVENKKLYIRELVMSCRVLKRGMESFIFNALIRKATELGIEVVMGDYLPTEKNSMVAKLFTEYGFSVDESATDYRFRQDVKTFRMLPNFIRERQ